MATISNNFSAGESSLNEQRAALEKSIAEQRAAREQIKKQLSNKRLSKKKKKKLNAKKSKITALINDIKRAEALLPKKFISTQSISGIRGSVKTVKIPSDNVFAVTTADIPAESMERLFFDSIGATEIINVERHDQINTANAPYQPIVDLASVNDEFNPAKIISLQKIASMYFNTFAIPFDLYEPRNGTGPSNEIVYIEESTGNLIINVVDLPSNLRVEVQVLSFEDILNDTVYGII
jgi:hypothetical protein